MLPTPTRVATIIVIFKKGKRLASVGKEAEKLEPFYVTDGNVKWCKTVWQFLKKFNMELPFDSVIPLLGVNQETENRCSNKYL